MSLQNRDKKHIWHPLTQHKTSEGALAIVAAKGVYLYDEKGNGYIDAIASWYTAMYGHCNEKITSAVAAQMLRLDHVVFTGFTHEPAIDLSEKLISILPENQQKIFFNDNGSTAVEVGIKMALQYHHNKGFKKNTLVAFEEGFHGDTFGAMSVSGLSVYNGPFEEFFLKVERIPVPNGANENEILSRLEIIFSENDCAAFVYEPLVQGAAGMKMHSREGLEKILKLCKRNNVLCIADEVMTGFGKTGKHFASNHLNTQPDIICLSKALTAGMMPMGITSCTQDIFDAFLDDAIGKGFFHAHTYSANPLACAAAIAGIDLLCSKEIQLAIERIEAQHKQFLIRIIDHPKVSAVRQLGVILALDLKTEMERYGDLRNRLYDHFMTDGIYLRPLGNTIYILPPYCITNSELKKIYDSILKALKIF
ncbi:adenosylmethionine--8-amino-7-oxononanoate transaminase [Constantimarinum furrinae]|uniref:Adenosylmethionine-8-amino-7-oxononanoate aminotransferase n=1 Tax=Constantimarinum furrinae TaxID=2562285 RepID=A0A7G8PSG0_9FLAO|nr:adenosylmethionine--8-amino-7-oxononanoate transaminase [Constantimarinum furrinae]QNJ97276.1 adenosylmethionine-8-amino-7-oxononanoate aminotransferase [Constantimarinum furrinae]